MKGKRKVKKDLKVILTREEEKNEEKETTILA